MDLGAIGKRLLLLRLPGWLLFLFWLFCLWRILVSGWIQESFMSAFGYVREVSFTA